MPHLWILRSFAASLPGRNNWLKAGSQRILIRGVVCYSDAADIVRRLYPDEKSVPFMMLAGGSGTAAGKGLIQQIQVRDLGRLYPSPVRKPTAAGAANLKTQEFDDAIMDPVIVRLYNPVFAVVSEPNHALVLDGCPEQFIDR
jgi:hypothetical protein